MGILISIIQELSFFTTIAPCLGIVVCCKMKRRKLYSVRLLFVPLIALIFNVSFWRIFGWDFAELMTFKIWPHLLMFALCFLCTWFCYEMHIVLALFFQSLAFVLVHLFSNISDLVLYLVKTEGLSYLFMSITMLFVAVLLICLIYFFIARRLPNIKRLEEYKATMVVFIVLNVAFSVIFAQLVFANTLGSAVVSALRIILCLCFIVLPFIIFSLSESHAEKNMYEQMMIQTEKYRRRSEENIDAINMKYHDLKYRLAALKEGDKSEEREALIAELESDIEIYGMKADTGNDIVDMVLTEKSLLCHNYRIQFICRAEASALGFMKKGDLYALLGNAIDNAIEAVKTVEEDKRLISLDISSRGNMVNLCLENYCEVPPLMVDGMPQTTKSDKAYHGFGVRNMKIITEKYGGTFFIDCGEQYFRLNIFFTLKNAG